MANALAPVRRVLAPIVTRVANAIVAKSTPSAAWLARAADIGWGSASGSRRVTNARTFSAVHAAISVLSQDVSKLPIHLYRRLPGGGRERVRQGEHPAARLLRRPNFYQTKTQWLEQLMLGLLYRGNAYQLAERDGANNVTALFPVRDSTPYVTPDSREIFYAVGHDSSLPSPEGVDIASAMFPARHVLHLRMQAIDHPLIGVTPLYAAAHSAETGAQILEQAEEFYKRAARPSGVLRTPKRLTPEVYDRVSASWESAYASGGENFGKIAILEEELQWQQTTLSTVEADVVNMLRFSVEDVARVYRVPTFMIGAMEKVTYRNAETLMRAYLTGTLSYYLELIEGGLDRFLGLVEDDEYFVEFDVMYLLRAELDIRMAAGAKAIQGGIKTPNEVRAEENLPPKDGGDQLFLQQQMEPVGDDEAEDDDDPSSLDGTGDKVEQYAREIRRRWFDREAA